MDILKGAWKTSTERKLSLFAGGVAYYVLLAMFPALAALVSIYGLVANPADVIRHAHAFYGMLPASAVTSIGTEFHQLTAVSSKSFGHFIAVWSALRGMSVNTKGERMRRLSKPPNIFAMPIPRQRYLTAPDSQL